MTLKQQVQIALIEKKWSQRELARRMKISMAY
ncbi:XRE family transcriptional regulator, partial [Enterococcus faecalis]|nr:XRE family transcriptional regulator [Enterococcus faecalis]